MPKILPRKHSGFLAAGIGALLFLGNPISSRAQEYLNGLKAISDASNKLYRDIEALPPNQRTTTNMMQLRQTDMAPATNVMNKQINDQFKAYIEAGAKAHAKIRAAEAKKYANATKGPSGASGKNGPAPTPTPVVSKREKVETEVTGAAGAKSVDLLAPTGKKAAEPAVKVNSDGIIE